MKPQTPDPKIVITEPVLESDFHEAFEIIKENLADWADHRAESLKDLSFGEVLVAKNDGKVAGVLEQRRPGKVFGEMKDKYFAFEKIHADKNNIGHINIIAVAKNHQAKGVGKLLLKRALELQHDFGAKCVNTFVWQQSPGMRSQKLFEGFGFEAIQLLEHPWFEYSKKVGLDKFKCVICGNPCKCDELEMVKYL